jgi:hypothetical protein
MKQGLLTTGLCILFWCGLNAQDYPAVQGSSYAGSTGVHNNPASIVNTPFAWDITLFGTQLKSSTNDITIYNYSLLSSPANSEYIFTKGEYSRFAKLNANINLLNTRIALGRKQAIAFGANLRSYTNISTSRYNFIDTLHSSGDFFKLNQNNTRLDGETTGSTWVELFGTYSRTIVDNAAGRLNAGITLKLSRGISGGYGRLAGGQFITNLQNNQPVYTVTGGTLLYGYSANYDRWQNSNTLSQNLNNFLKYTNAGFSFDIGAEYLVKAQEISSFGDDDDYFDYDWKLGVSVLDIGFNQYTYGRESRYFGSVKNNINNAAIDNKFNNSINSLHAFNDSLSTLVNDVATPGGKFRVMNPTRLVINVDRFIQGAFFVNADLSINVPNTLLTKYLHITETNLLTLTPRWETRKLGVYLPIQFNNQNQCWIGGAFKAGPLLVGIHNWANLFSKTKMQNGGGYIAFIIRPGKNSTAKTDRRLDCPR